MRNTFDKVTAPKYEPIVRNFETIEGDDDVFEFFDEYFSEINIEEE